MLRYCVHILVLLLMLAVLTVSSQAQPGSNLSTVHGIRVGDYTDQLSSGTSLPLYTLIWRAVGSSFSVPGSVNQSLETQANTAFLEPRHSMTYTVANIKWNTVIINTTRTVNDDSGRWPAFQAGNLTVLLIPPPSNCSPFCSGRMVDRL